MPPSHRLGRWRPPHGLAPKPAPAIEMQALLQSDTKYFCSSHQETCSAFFQLHIENSIWSCEKRREARCEQHKLTH